jgi:hypothetical protein
MSYLNKPCRSSHGHRDSQARHHHQQTYMLYSHDSLLLKYGFFQHQPSLMKPTVDLYHESTIIVKRIFAEIAKGRQEIYVTQYMANTYSENN